MIAISTGSPRRSVSSREMVTTRSSRLAASVLVIHLHSEFLPVQRITSTLPMLDE